MRRSQVLVLLALASGAMSVLLAVAVNVATGGTLPGSLEWASDWAWPAVVVLAVVTVGLAFWQEQLHDGTNPVTPPSTPVPAELPDRSLHFAGRAAELTKLAAIVSGGASVVAIAGSAGVGKSSLALHFARSLRASYPDGQLFVRLRGAGKRPTDPVTVLKRLLAVLGATEPELHGDVDALAGRYRTRLAGKRVLILLDNAADVRQIRPLLPGHPGSLVLITSRRVMAHLGEATLFDLDVMGAPDARDLLAALVGRDRVDAEPAATDDLLRACGYLPIAVGIAGARLRARPTWTIAALAERLADERRRLDELRLGDSEVRASFAASYRELSEKDRLVFRRLGAHPGSDVTTGAAAALADDDPAVVGAALERLADVRLVEAVAPDRYWRHDLLRLFAAERLAAEEPAEDEPAFARLVAWYAGQAAASSTWLDAEWDGFITAVSHAVERGWGELAWQLAEAMTLLVDADRRGRAPFRRNPATWAALVDFARRSGDQRRLVRGLIALGRAYDYDGFVQPALTSLSEGVARATALGDVELRASAHKGYGHALRGALRHAEALHEYQRALDLYRAAGREDGEADVLDGLGNLHLTRQEYDEAFAVLGRAMALRERIGSSEHKVVWTELLVGLVQINRGHLADGGPLLERTMATFRRLGDRPGEAYAYRALGSLAWREGRFADAADLHARAERGFAELRIPIGIGLAQESRAEALRSGGDPAAAAVAFEAAVATFARLGDDLRQGIATLKLARALAEAGRQAEAIVRRAEAEVLLKGVDLPEADSRRRQLDQLGVRHTT